MTIFKDFCWFIFKNNYVVNILYARLLPFVFKKSSQRFDDCQFTTKNDLRDLKKPLFSIKGYSSGTTNTPLTVYRSFTSILLEEYVFKSYIYRNSGLLNPKIAVIRGDVVSAADDHRVSRIESFSRRLILSSYHLGPKHVEKYFQALEEYKPDVIHAYPSSILVLAKFALAMNWRPNWPLSMVVTSSETFLLDDIKVVESVFGQVFDHYGQAERVAVLQRCTQARYHVRSDYSVVEFIDFGSGLEIVGSNLHNSAMPIVRYRTGDFVEDISHELCLCGSSEVHVGRIIGRNDDYLVLKDGTQIGRLDVVFKGIDGLLECQLVQQSFEQVSVRYVASSLVGSNEIEAKIHENLNVRIGHSMQVVFERLAQVPRAKSGKFKSVVRAFNAEN